MNVQLRKWGRRILGYPNGTPNPVVLLDLGWSDMQTVAMKKAANLCSRLASRGQRGSCADLASRVYAYASSHPSSWAFSVRGLLEQEHIPALEASGLNPGASRAAYIRWRQLAHSSLENSSLRRSLQAAREISSLAGYLQYKPRPRMPTTVHNRRIATADAREWGLARCGHHWCSDGRLARHNHLGEQCFMCHASSGTLEHALFECPRTADLRAAWIMHTGHSPTALTLPDLFDHASIQDVPAAVRFVARVCRRAGAAAAAADAASLSLSR